MQVGRALCSKPPLTHRVNGTTPLMVAAARGNAASVHRLLVAGSNPNESTSKMHFPVPERGVTPLMCSCSCKGAGGLACVQKLLAFGAHINTQDGKGLTALHHAVLADNREIVESLLRSGADASIVDVQGRTSVDYALELREQQRERREAAEATGEDLPQARHAGRPIADMLLYSDAFVLNTLG